MVFALYWAWGVSKKSHNIQQMVLSIVTLLSCYANLFYSHACLVAVSSVSVFMEPVFQCLGSTVEILLGKEVEYLPTGVSILACSIITLITSSLIFISYSENNH